MYYQVFQQEVCINFNDLYGMLLLFINKVKVLWCRFNLSFEADAGDSDSDSDAESDSIKPRFSSIKKASGFLDKELSASGFSRKEQADIEKVFDAFIDVGFYPFLMNDDLKF